MGTFCRGISPKGCRRVSPPLQTRFRQSGKMICRLFVLPSSNLPMPLPPPQPRTRFHTRTLVTHGWRRDDGLWDIEAELIDAKDYDVHLYGQPALAAGAPVHSLAVRLTVDDAMVVQAVATSMDATPFGECLQAAEPMRRIIGAGLGPGWRGAVDRAMGGTAGCTHLREILVSMGTSAYQTIPSGQARLRRQSGLPDPQHEVPPRHVGGCISWDVDGPVVARHYPQFAGWAPLRRRQRQ